VTSRANLIIKAGSPPAIPPQADGTPMPVKTWLMQQGLDESVAERVAASELPQTVADTELVELGDLLAGTPEQQAVARKLLGLVFEQLLPLISGIQFADKGKQLSAILAQHFSPAEQQLLQQTTTSTVLPEDLLDRAGGYCTTQEQLDQLLKVIAAKFYVSQMKYEGSFERVTEALLQVK
jgi:hypothetical protein